MWMQDPCYGPIEAHHAASGGGMALKSHDHGCIPLCLKHHQDLHGSSGPFRHMGKDGKRDWQDRQIRWTQNWLGLPGAEPQVKEGDLPF